MESIIALDNKCTVIIIIFCSFGFVLFPNQLPVPYGLGSEIQQCTSIHDNRCHRYFIISLSPYMSLSYSLSTQKLTTSNDPYICRKIYFPGNTIGQKQIRTEQLSLKRSNRSENIYRTAEVSETCVYFRHYYGHFVDLQLQRYIRDQRTNVYIEIV